MNCIETPLKGCIIIEPITFSDERGLFFESFHKKKFEAATGINPDFVQDNQSVSKKGVLRGLHYQDGASAQAKLVRVLKGEVLDVVVDLRRESNTFGEHYKIKLSEANRKSVFIPRGMAHGFLALTEEVVFSYKCDNYYNKTSERGIIYSDSELNIDWEYPLSEIIISEKDEELPSFNSVFS